MKKIPTIFVRNPENMREILNKPHPACAWVFNGEGIATRKYDGTCCKIDNQGYWKRREVKKDKYEPSGFVLEEMDEITGKKVGWLLVDPSDNSDRYHIEAYDKELPHGTYELCGPKIQKNPERLGALKLIDHSEAEVMTNVPRSYEALKEYLYDKDIEGIVFHHPDGRMGKIKKRDFNQRRVI